MLQAQRCLCCLNAGQRSLVAENQKRGLDVVHMREVSVAFATHAVETVVPSPFATYAEYVWARSEELQSSWHGQRYARRWSTVA